MIDKRFASAREAVADVHDGATVMIGGFGEAGSPIELIHALIDQGATGLTVVSNNTGTGLVGLAALLRAGRVRKVVCSFPKTAGSTVFPDLYRAGKVELELVPQGTLAERIRAGGAGVAAFYTPTAAGTPLADDPSRHPDDDEQADKYIVADQLLTAAGLANYEISNWALPGEECRHNRVYWEQGNYEGFGCAAHSHRDGRRWWNVRTPDRYVDLVRAGESVAAADEVLDEPTRRFEKLELSLRTSRGVPVGALDVAAVELQGLVEVRDGNAVLTRAGRLLANEISTRLNP